MNQRLSPAKKLTLGAMVTALTMLSLYAAAVLPAGRISCYFLSSIFIFALCAEGAYVTALTAFAASAGLAWLLLPDKLVAAAYTLLLGHYNIFKTILDTHLESIPFRVVLKLLYCSVFTAAGLYVAIILIGVDVMANLPEWLPVWGVVAAAEAAFIMLDVLQSLLGKFYVSRIRSVIVPRR